ncbi:Guanine nucleotide binding protein MIP1 [Ceraceosorus bombacis]|uniref:Guanine nucleotide binding protein MIP1 n=1 Tax=Ceraceosorus bombacis TaxID=401625 RepID=A0A0N7LA81_9BASI|nr:Guanine nucleotide binding protein MIP1 [Ceraceosorus bombacis]
MHSPSIPRHGHDGPPSEHSSASSSPGGAHLGGLREVLPLKSRLFAWCSEYYTEPQMKSAEAEEPGSVKYNVQTWKRQRNERIIREASAETEHASNTPWTESAGTLRNGSSPYLMLMHEVESHLVAASEQDTISVWDWEEQRLLARFKNGNPEKTNITSLSFVNEAVDTLLLVGSAQSALTFHPHKHLLAYADASSSISLVKCPPAKAKTNLYGSQEDLRIPEVDTPSIHERPKSIFSFS